MANKFVTLSQTHNGINVFRGEDGSLIKTIPYPGVSPPGGYTGTILDMAYDGIWVAANEVVLGKLFFINVDDETVIEFATDGSLPLGHGFDAGGTFYLGVSGGGGYRRWAAPYASDEFVSALGEYKIFPGPDPAKSLAGVRDSGSGDTTFYRFDLSTGIGGDQIGPVSSDTSARRAMVDPNSQTAIFFYASSYGTRMFDYETGAETGGSEPVSGSANEGGQDYNTGIAFLLDLTGDFSDYVIKSSATNAGIGGSQGGAPSQIDLSALGDGVTLLYVEGKLSDEMVLITGDGGQLFGFNVRTDSIEWNNSSGVSNYNYESKSAAATAPWGSGGAPPDPPDPDRFWTDLRLAYETV